MTQQLQVSTFEKMVCYIQQLRQFLYHLIFNKLSNDTKFIKLNWRDTFENTSFKCEFPVFSRAYILHTVLLIISE